MTSLPVKPLLKADLRDCLAIWSEHPKTSTQQLSTQVGISRERVRIAKSWAILSHLLNERGLTKEGEIALEKDPYLESTVTDWLIHFFCTFGGDQIKLRSERVSEWEFVDFVAYNFLADNPKFTQEDLLHSASQHLADSSLGSQVKVWLKIYTQKSSIENCQFLVHKNGFFMTGMPNLENPYIVGYLLASIWQRDFGSQKSLLVSDLINTHMGISRVLGIQEAQIHQQLDRLTDLEVIEQRSAKPHKIGTQPERKQPGEKAYIVVRCWENPLELLSKAYEQDPAVPNRPLTQALEGILGDDDELPFLSSVRSWLLNLGPQQSQLASEYPTLNLFLHLAS